VTIGSRAKRQSEAVEDVTAERCHASGATMLDQQQKMQSVVMNQQAQAPATGNLQFMDSSNYGSGGGGYSGPWRLRRRLQRAAYILPVLYA